MATLRDLGEFIREQRRNARISLRQLAEQAGVSNPYLSQIERGLRKPSAAVLQQIAAALRVSTPVIYLRAGLLDPGDGQAAAGEATAAAITADPDLTERQKQTLIEIYTAFRRENIRESTGEPIPGVDSTDDGADLPPTTKSTVDIEALRRGSAQVAERARMSVTKAVRAASRAAGREPDAAAPDGTPAVAEPAVPAGRDGHRTDTD